MAKTKLMGNVVTIESTLTFEGIETVGKYRPSELVLTEGEGKEKEEVFRIATGEKGSVSKFGMVFNALARDDEGKAIVTVIRDDLNGKDNEEAKEILADDYGLALTYLAQLEAKLPQVIEGIKAERDAVKAGIELA